MEEKNSQANSMMSAGDSDSGSQGSGLAPNIASLLCYICFLVTGIIFLVIEKENKEVKFHAWQSIFLDGSALVMVVALEIIAYIPILGAITWVFAFIFFIAYMAIKIIAVIKAYQGEHWLIPILGNLAEQQVNKVS